MQMATLFYIFSQYATNIQVSPDCYSFITGISSFNSQLTLVYILNTGKRGKRVLPYYSISNPPSKSAGLSKLYLTQGRACSLERTSPYPRYPRMCLPFLTGSLLYILYDKLDLQTGEIPNGADRYEIQFSDHSCNFSLPPEPLEVHQPRRLQSPLQQ